MTSNEITQVLEAFREHAAFLAWLTGMQLHAVSAKETASEIAERIRKIELDKFVSK